MDPSISLFKAQHLVYRPAQGIQANTCYAVREGTYLPRTKLRNGNDHLRREQGMTVLG